MKRELNPQLFQDEQVISKSTENLNPISPIDSADLQIISAQLDGVKDKLKQVISKVQAQDASVNGIMSETSLKFDKFKQAFHRVEDYVKNNIHEVRAQVGKLNSKVVASQLSEKKIEQLLQRQNEVVLNFEYKLNQLQKVISEQELQLLNYKTALSEARQEIQRLKKL